MSDQIEIEEVCTGCQFHEVHGPFFTHNEDGRPLEAEHVCRVYLWTIGYTPVTPPWCPLTEEEEIHE